jgi:DNA-binding NarL/FixJ family response regulator
MFSPDSPQVAKPVSVSIPGALAAKIAKLADVRESSFSETLFHLIEKGFEEIDKKIDVFYGSDDIGDLSPRQRAVLDCLRQGLAVKEVADKLKVSEVTVRTHILRIRQRLGCADILELRIPGN